MEKAKGRGNGKIILFNEHFVVYGVPAIASSINRFVEAEVTPNTHLEIIDERINTINDLIEMKILTSMTRKMGIDIEKNPVRIVIRGDLPLGSGLGASAATCVAIARALSSFFNLDLSDDEINSVAYEGERIYHGSPSGIDNTVATFGGILWFEREKKIENIKVKKPLYMVIVNTGINASTKKAIQIVRQKKEENPERFNQILEEARRIAQLARESIEGGNIENVGKLMNRNHELLREVGVSCTELDRIVEISIKSGALGAKLTGGGLGGNAIALVDSQEKQDLLVREMEKKGFGTWKVKVV